MPDRFRQPEWYSLMVTMVSVLLMGVLAMLYASHVANESQRRWCGLIVTMDDAYRATPPQTPTGRDVAARIAVLRADLGC